MRASKPMRSYLTADDYFSEILMQRTADARVVLIVEGPSDLGALAPFVIEDSVDLKEFGGKEAALSVLRKCNENLVSKIAALVDADFGHVNPDQAVDVENAFVTDSYDLEASILQGDSILGRFISNHFDIRKLPGRDVSTSVTLIRQIVEKLAYEIGTVRYLASLADLPLNLSNVPVESCIDIKNFELDVSQLVLVGLARCGITDLTTRSTVSDRVHTLVSSLEVDDPYMLCRGHDLIKVLAFLGKKLWGSSTGADQAERAIRASLDGTALKCMTFHSELANWGELNDAAIWSAA